MRAFSSLAQRPLGGRHFVQDLNALGVPVVSSRMVRVALLGVNPCVMRLVAPRENRFDPSCP